MKKKHLAYILIAAILISIMPTTVMADTSDLNGHWAKNVIEDWSNQGLIKGYEDGTFKPNNNVSRAEFVTMMNNAIHNDKRGTAQFKDVAQTAWYYNAISTAIAAGYCSGYEDGTFKPNASITRAEAAVMIANATSLTSNPAGADKFTDAASIPAWAKGSIGATVTTGYMSGYPDDSFGVSKSITRAECVSSLNRVMEVTAQNAIPNKPMDKEELIGKKDILVTKKDTLIENKTIRGNVVIEKELENGRVTIANTIIDGDLVIKGADTVYLYNVDIKDRILIDKDDVLMEFSGKTKAKTVLTGTSTELTTKDFKGNIETICIETDKKVTIHTPADKVVLTDDAAVYLKADIKKVEVHKEAKGARVSITKGVTVDKVVADTKVALIGYGKIVKLEANADDITVDKALNVRDIQTAKGVKKPAVSSSVSGGGSGSNGSNKPKSPISEGSDETVKPENPDISEKPEKKENILYSYGEQNNTLKLYVKSDNKNINEVKSDLLGKISEEKRSKVYFGQIFPDQNRILIVDPYGILSTENVLKETDYPEATDGLYLTDENNNLVKYSTEKKKLFTSTTDGGADSLSSKKDLHKDIPLMFIAGKVSCDDRTLTAVNIIGYPRNEAHLGLSVLGNTRLIEGINFVAKDTVPAKAQNAGFISLTKDHELNVEIRNNTFNFDGESSMIKAMVGYSAAGIVNFHHNKIEGKRTVEYKSPQHGVVQMLERSKNPVKLLITNNEFKNIKPSAIRMMVGANEDVTIENNTVDGVEDSAFAISIFPVEYPRKMNLIVSGNEIRNYGLGYYEDWNPDDYSNLIPCNKEESGINLNFVEQSYGTFINGKWTSSVEEIDKLIKNSNKVMEKVQNDKNENVVNSTDVLIGPVGRIVETRTEINKNSYGNSKHIFVITKNENGSAIFGQNPNDFTQEIEVGGLFIVGEGTGTVTIPSTLKIKGDLTIDLPNGKVENHAVVKGKTEIKAQSLIANDAVFKVTPRSFVRGKAPEEGVKIAITDVKNDTGEALAVDRTTWNHIEIFVNGKALEVDDYSLDETKDEIHISKAVADQWTKKAVIMVRISSSVNGISMLNSPQMEVIIEDKSDFDLEWSKTSIIHMNPDNEEIVVKVKNIRDKFGNMVSAEESRLKADFIEIGMSSLAHLITIDDEKDEIHLQPELLRSLSATRYTQQENLSLGMSLSSSLKVSAPENEVAEKESKLPIEVIDNSKASFVFEKGLTFTQGNAPKEGLKLYVKDIVDTKGNKVSEKDSVLTDNINIEPFPASRDNTEDSELIVKRDENGNYVKEIFNPKFIIIDDEQDTITFTQQYLNKMKTQNDSSTEAGIKIFTFLYKDGTACVDMRSTKTPLYIKKEEVPKSTTIDFSFKEGTYKIEGDTIIANGLELSEDTMVSTVLGAAEKTNPRQQILILSSNGTVREDFASLNQGDRLMIKAEDTRHSKEYRLVLDISKRPDLVTEIDKSIILDYDRVAMKVKNNKTVEDVIKAITTAEGVTIDVVSVDEVGMTAVIPEQKITSEYKVRAVKGSETYLWNIIPVRGESRSRALLIGNWDYAGDKMDLSGPKTDLKLMEALFKGNRLEGKATEVTKITNVMKADFAPAVENAFAGATEEDVSYIYYSGHGNNLDDISYICTVDDKVLPNGKIDPAGWVSVNELREMLDKVPGKKILILDCCNAGGFIGKKAVGVDMITSPTVQVGKSDSDNSVAFLKDVKDVFTDKESNKDLNYLTTDNYKVLVASSANEYSYEDVKEGIGKFTRSLAIAAGIENGNMKGDRNNDKILDLNEAYEYLMDNVASISHIQVFPYLEEFPLFEDMQIEPLSGDTGITSDKYNVIISNDGRCMIKAKAGEVISSELTAEEFISGFNKNHKNQELSIVYLNGSDYVSLAKSEKLGEGPKYLQVEAENGDIARYVFIAVKLQEKSANTEVSSKDNGIEIIKSGVVTSIKVTKEMTVGTFLNGLEKGHANQELTVYQKGSNVAKQAHEKIENFDRLEVVAEDRITIVNYTILYSIPVALVPDFGTSFRVEDKTIVSGEVKITTNMTVGEFKSYWQNKTALEQEKIDPYMSGVFVKGALGPFVAPKKDDQYLAVGDSLRLKPFPEGQAVDYTIVIEASGTLADQIAVPDWGWRWRLDGNNIVEQGDFLNNSIKFKDLENGLTNKKDYTEFKFYGADGKELTEEDVLEDGAKMRFYKGDIGYKEYTIQFPSNEGIVVPPIIIG